MPLPSTYAVRSLARRAGGASDALVEEHRVAVGIDEHQASSGACRILRSRSPADDLDCLARINRALDHVRTHLGDPLPRVRFPAMAVALHLPLE